MRKGLISHSHLRKRPKLIEKLMCLHLSVTILCENMLTIYGSGSLFTCRGSMFHIASAYSSMHLSLVKKPILATVVMVLVTHSSWSL